MREKWREMSNMAMEYVITPMELSMRGNGTAITHTVMGRKYGFEI